MGLAALGVVFGAGVYHRQIVTWMKELGIPVDAGRNEAVVERVVDGDTFVITVNGREEKVRLIGIDTPESRVNEKAGRDARRTGKDTRTIVALGKEAKRFVEKLVPVGSVVRIETDAQERDKYGRLLAYVYLADGRMVNEEIILAGYAAPMTYPPNVRHEVRFRAAYRHARENKEGLWK